jgi:hypothetical protein
LFDVAENSHDGGPRTGGVAGVGPCAHELADRVLVGKSEVGKGLADEHGGGRSGDVVVVEQAAPDERDVHGFDVAGSDGVAQRRRLLGSGFALDFDAVHVAVAAERELRSEACGDDSGKLPDAVECGGEEADKGGVGVEAAA